MDERPASVQIMSGQINQGRGGHADLPTMPLDTNVGTRGPTSRASVLDGGRKQKVLSFTAWNHDADADGVRGLRSASVAAGAGPLRG